MTIEALLFDLGKVLIDFDMDKGVRSLVDHCSTSRDEFEEVLWNKKWIRGYESGRISTEEFHRYLCDSGTLSMSFPSFCQTWTSIFRPDLIVSESVLLALRSQYPLILVSNTNHVHAEFIRRNYSVFDHFDHLILSHEVGSLKPDRKIYERAIEAAGKPPDRLFFTDDREENILAARKMGIHAHQFIDERHLVEALGRLGVHCVKTRPPISQITPIESAETG